MARAKSRKSTANNVKKLDRRTLNPGHPSTLKPFVKGDPRINLSGRPKLIGEANRKVLASVFPQDRISDEMKKLVAAYTGDPDLPITYAERIAIGQALKAAGGDTNAAREMRSATEANKIELTGADGGPVKIEEIESVRKRRWDQVAATLKDIESAAQAESDESKDGE